MRSLRALCNMAPALKGLTLREAACAGHPRNLQRMPASYYLVSLCHAKSRLHTHRMHIIVASTGCLAPAVEAGAGAALGAAGSGGGTGAAAPGAASGIGTAPSGAGASAAASMAATRAGAAPAPSEAKAGISTATATFMAASLRPRRGTARRGVAAVAIATGGGTLPETGRAGGGGGLAGHLHLFSLVKAANAHTRGLS